MAAKTHRHRGGSPTPRRPDAGSRGERRRPASRQGEPLGALLIRLRLAQGLSQLRLAELLCAAAASPTVTRHEVSRWERGERIPGPFWLGWLSVVLEAPMERLEAAVAAARGGEAPPARTGDHEWLWRPATAADLLAALDHAGVDDARDLAHAWLAGPAEPPEPVPTGLLRQVLVVGEGTSADTLADLEARLVELRRMDDVVGGVDLAGRTDRELRAALTILHTVGASGGQPRRRALRAVAGFAQLAGWAHADAGTTTAARRAYRVALRAAAAAGDRPLAAHVLGALSHDGAGSGNPQEALVLARSGHAGARADGSPLLQALLLHRIALAAAQAGERRAAELALAEAERVADRSEPGREPTWLYWLTSDELQAMTGRCWAALGRPLRAAQLLSRWQPRPRRSAIRRAPTTPPPVSAGPQPATSVQPATGADDQRPGAGWPVGYLTLPPQVGPRTAALYAIWLARSYLAIGEVEQGCVVATRAMKPAVASGSARAATALRHLHPLLLRYRDIPVVRRYERFAEGTFDRLPDADRDAGSSGGHASVAS